MLRKKGFTLIELLIVIAVISILIGIALPRFKGMQDEGNIAKVKGELRTLQTAIESYCIHTGTYPAALTSLTGATPNITGSALPADPFNNSGGCGGPPNYGYVRGGTSNGYYVIYSIGPSGNGSATILNDAVSETNGSSCIYISNIGTDSQP